jgi:hypothetical protein
MANDDSDDDKSTTETTFTRAQFAREVAKQVRAKVAEALADYGDLDELKAKAATADKQKTQLDKVAEQLDTLTKRAEAAEVDVARTKVADKLGLTPREAGRLKGKTYAELLADGEELVEDLGIDTAARKRGEQQRKPKGTTDDAGSDDGDDESDEHDDADGDDGQQQETQREERRPAPRRRPRELRSGAPATTGPVEPSDPLELIKSVPRGR